MSRDKKPEEEKKELPKALRETIRLTQETLRLISDEKVFPKKSRWIMSHEISKIVNRVHTTAMFANGIDVDKALEAERPILYLVRMIALALTLAWMSALDAKMSLSLDVLNTNANRYLTWGRQYLKTRHYIQDWRRADINRYTEKYGRLGTLGTRGIAAVVAKLIEGILG
uniref:Uncharacterized protein n=1 Tax=uncultured bacterium Contig643 TaxID=1393602 RepID=W0FMQ9_9BACT|nr:hypothetical protein [uncultured bacterium Contig643]